MIAHIELCTELADISKESELANMSSNWKDLSTITVKGGKTFILKNTSQIMIPKLERNNILNIAHQMHLGQEMMINQLCRKVFWNKMNFDINKLVKECDPCQRHHRSHTQKRVDKLRFQLCHSLIEFALV